MERVHIWRISRETTQTRLEVTDRINVESMLDRRTLRIWFQRSAGGLFKRPEIPTTSDGEVEKA